jgi:hypothetical protein
MTNLDDNKEIEKSVDDRRDFLDPTTTAAIGWFVFVESARGVVAFLTMKVLRNLWIMMFGKEDKKHVKSDAKDDGNPRESGCYQEIFDEDAEE